jgi:hypothetical protein
MRPLRFLAACLESPESRHKRDIYFGPRALITRYRHELRCCALYICVLRCTQSVISIHANFHKSGARKNQVLHLFLNERKLCSTSYQEIIISIAEGVKPLLHSNAASDHF